MSQLFFASLALFLAVEVFSAARILFSSFSVGKPTLAVWSLVPFVLVSILLWNHADLFDAFHAIPSLAFLAQN